MLFNFTRILTLVLLPLVSLSQSPVIKKGIWRGVIEMQEQELPFIFEVSIPDSTDYLFTIINADERIVVDEYEISGDSLFIRMPVFDSEFRVKMFSNRWDGLYVNHARKDKNVFPFHATSNKANRFNQSGDSPITDISGRWECDFSKGTPDSSKAVGIFQQKENIVAGTFLTPSGDYRFLEGSVSGKNIWLSAFDGAHAFLFNANVMDDGTLAGTFYSGNHWKESWVAKRNEKFELPDPYSLTRLKSGFEHIDFSFPDLNGDTISLSDERFRNKVVIVQIMGSWCPNCMDEATYYAQLYEEYNEDGLEIIALAFERFNDFTKFQYNIRRMNERLGVTYPVLFAGTAGADNIYKALPMIESFIGYPTSFFIDKKGKVRKIYAGINGPATGSIYSDWREEVKATVISLLAE